MAQQRETTTDRLVTVIASIKLERKSGQLSVRRGEGSTLEEGVLIFAQGQITQASAGRRSGSEAFNWLSTWRQARYIFTPTASNGAKPQEPISMPALPSSNNGTVPGQRVPAMPSEVNALNRMNLMAPSYEVPHTVVDLSVALARIDQVQLSRVYRRLYMLIDGHRSITDLVPLIGKPTEEVRNMLRTLEWIGIIRMINLPPIGP